MERPNRGLTEVRLKTPVTEEAIAALELGTVV